MKTSTSFISRLLTGLLLGLGLLNFPVQTATAQSTDGPPTLIEHLRSELRSSDAMRRQLALVDVTALAHCPSTCTRSLHSLQNKRIRIENETGIGSVVDLTALVPDLLESYRSGPADGHRLLALSALLNIGNEKALDRLIEEGASQSEKVNRNTQVSLAAFYLEKYPELTEQTMRTNRLSLEDVARIRALHVKRSKKEAKENN